MAQQIQERPLHPLEPYIEKILNAHNLGYRPHTSNKTPSVMGLRGFVTRQQLIACWGDDALEPGYIPSQAQLEAGSAELEWIATIISTMTSDYPNNVVRAICNSRTVAILSWLKRNSRSTASPEKIGLRLKSLVDISCKASRMKSLSHVLGNFHYMIHHNPTKIEKQARKLAALLNQDTTKKERLIVLEKDYDRPENSAVIKEWDLPPADALLPKELDLVLTPTPATNTAPIPPGQSIMDVLHQILANQERIIAGLGLR